MIWSYPLPLGRCGWSLVHLPLGYYFLQPGNRAQVIMMPLRLSMHSFIGCGNPVVCASELILCYPFVAKQTREPLAGVWELLACGRPVELPADFKLIDSACIV